MSSLNSLDILPSTEGIINRYIRDFNNTGIGLNELVLRSIYSGEERHRSASDTGSINQNDIIENILPERVTRRWGVNTLDDLCVPVGVPIAKVVNVSWGRVTEVIDPTDLDHKDFELNWGKRKIVYGQRILDTN